MSLMMSRRRQAVERSQGEKPQWLKNRMELQSFREKSREIVRNGKETDKERDERLKQDTALNKKYMGGIRSDIAKNLDSLRNKKPLTPEQVAKKREKLKKKRDAETKTARAKLAKSAAEGAKDSKSRPFVKNPEPPEDSKYKQPKGEVRDGSK